ncbi:phosphoribosyl-ATP diphosphatase [Kordiimonas aquimaris]|uniref:phosphoribosyl-ATP diphosphatase n=1 Tax=Kordiimonas aquimaris TaxID=707591 RepID=UPI0021D08B33|nr:phosphoribosyl-ATP diphosphatase [Kordiimonas aquimaris]
MDTKTVETLTTLAATLHARKQAGTGESYVASLYNKGAKKIAQKVGEEAVETAMAVAADNNEEIITESADLLFHLMVLLEARGLSLNDVAAELAKREGTSGLTEKANRS